MMIGMSKKSGFFKAVSLFLVFSFSFYNVSFAAADRTVSAPPSVDIELSVPAVSVDDIGVAIDAGEIKSKYSGSSGKVIVHIQDAHCNFEAQSNINKILGQLTKENGIDMISVEGAEGLVDTAWFRAFPDAEIRKEVATYFMKKGEITGAEFFSINSDYEGSIFGAETRDYYVKNLKAFTEVYPYKDQIEKYLTDTQVITSRLKSIVYPPALKAVDSKIKSFKEKETELSDYSEYLRDTALKNKIDIKPYENFGKLLQTLEYERKIDFDIVDQERTTYIDLLSKKLPKQEMTELVAQSIKFKKGHIEAVHFYSYLRDLARDHDIAMVQEYPNLFYYYIYTKLYDGINNENLFREIGKIETSLKAKLFQDDTQRNLDKYASMLDMYASLVNIELTNEDYDQFKAYSKEFTMEDVLTFIRKLSGRYNLNYSIGAMPLEIKERLPNMVDFYEIAMKRDTALINNTLEKMKEDGKDRCVLIAGGFHTRGIKNLLEKKGVSYVVVTPKITKDVETPYIKVLTNQRTSLEDIITESVGMPAAGMKASNEEIVKPKADFLAPRPKIFSCIPLLMQNPEVLEMIGQKMGVIEGKSLKDSTEYMNDEIISCFIKAWLVKEREKANAKVWQKAVKNWSWLLGAYLKAYNESAKKAGFKLASDLTVTEGEVPTNDMLPAINDEFKEIFMGVVAKENLSPGQQAVRIDSENDMYESLAPEQADAINNVIAQLMEAQNPEPICFVTPWGEIEACVLVGFKEAVEEYNIAHDVNIPIDVDVHPGTGKGKWNRFYIDSRNWIALSDSQKHRLATHERYHIANPQHDEQKAVAVLQDALMDIRAKFEEVEVARLRNSETRMLEETAGLQEVLGNIDGAQELSKNNINVKIVAVVPGDKVDQQNWEDRLQKTGPKIFNSDGSTLVLSVQEKIGEKTREGNFLGTLLAYSRIKEIAKQQNVPYRDFVTLIGMLFGRGERMSPFTQIEGDRKPAISVTAKSLEIDGRKIALSAIEEALMYFTPVAKYLERCGFRGILDKWGDETEIASVDLTKIPENNKLMAEYDVIKVVSVLKITDELANQKDWVVFDDDANVLSALSRNEKKVLISQLEALGIKPRANGEFYAGISLGPVAVSYDVLDIMEQVFYDDVRKPGVFFDFDPYLLMALAMDDDVKKWEAAVQADKGLQKLVGMVDKFFEKVQEVKLIFKERYKRDLNLKTLDLGAGVFWADIGLHSAMREKYLALNDKGPKGIIARKLENISGVGKDKNGNIIVNSTINPDISVKNSVLINANLTGKGEIIGSVVKGATLNDPIMEKAFAIESYRPVGSNTLKKDSGMYKSLGAENLILEEGERHGTLLTEKGPIGMKVHEKTDLRDKAKTYNVAILGNEISFDAAYNEMFGVSMEVLESRRGKVVETLDRIRKKSLKFNPLQFGTSGIRGKVTTMTDMECYINTRGFIQYLKEVGEIRDGEMIAVAGDLRSSTPRIMKAVRKAIISEGCKADYCGYIPSPALAYYAMQNGMPSIMVTGSHIPDDRNGIKFTKKAGEVLKSDEAGILRNVGKARISEYSNLWKESVFSEKGMFKTNPGELGDVNEQAKQVYVQRYVNVFPPETLKGIEVALYQHSAVGRDIAVEVFEALGAAVTLLVDAINVSYVNDLGEEVTESVDLRSETFVPVDTEKVVNKTRAILKYLAEMCEPSAIITLDGDSDRPLFADENGNVLTGDMLGGLVAQFLNPDFAAFPISANDGLLTALGDLQVEIQQTKIGSPYVVKAMNDKLVAKPDAKVVGWECNGGFLTGSDWNIGKGVLKALPTRDALLPLITALILAKQENLTVSELVERKLPHRYTHADVIDNTAKGCENYTSEMGKDIIALLSLRNESIKEIRFGETGILVQYAGGKQDFMADNEEKNAGFIMEATNVKRRLETYFNESTGFGEIVSINWLDGLRIGFVNGDVSHYRGSGNAPEFRNYAIANTQERAREIVKKRFEIVPKIIKDVQGDSKRVSPGQQAVRIGISKAPSAWQAVRNRAIRGGGYSSVSTESRVKYLEALKVLNDLIQAGEMFQVTPYFALGLNGYTWGKKLLDSAILENMLGEKIKSMESIKTINRSLTEDQLELAVQAGKLEKDENGEFVGDRSFLEWLGETEIAERWFETGKIDLGSGYFELPVKTLSFFKGEAFSHDEVDYLDSEYGITAKHLDSRIPLSLQMHKFVEMIIPLTSGEAYFGVKDDITAEEFETACREGKVEDVLNKVRIETGKPIVVPALMPHAYGKVTVYEVKSVTSDEDANGTISFFDRLKYLGMKDNWQQLGIMSLAMTKEKLSEINPKRLKKDVLTMTPEQLTDTRKWLKEAERRGMLKKTDIGKLYSKPVLTSASETADKAKFEIMGNVPGTFISGMYTIAEGESIEQAEVFKNRHHPLFIENGDVTITTSRGKTFEVKQGEEIIMYPAMGTYTIKSTKGRAIVFTQVKPLPEVTKLEKPIELGEKIAETGTHTFEKNMSLVETQNGVETFHTVEIVGDQPVAGTVGKEFKLKVQAGTVTVKVKLPAGKQATSQITKWDSLTIPKDAQSYTMTKTSVENVLINIGHDNPDEEKDVSTTWKAVMEARTAIAKEKYTFIAPKAMYVDGEGPGSRKWEEDTLNEYLHSTDCLDINVYNAEVENILTDNYVRAAIENAVRDKRIPLLVATQKLFDEASKNEGFLNFLKENKVRLVPPIPSLDKLDNQGWFFTREVEGQALLQGLLTVESIEAKDTFARKVQKVVSQSLRRYVDINELYYLVGFGDEKIPAAYRPKSTLEWMVYMINSMLQRMEIKAYNPHEELEKQRRTMYSV